MMLRFLSRLLRGPARPRQLIAATVLGALIAFVPDYGAQPLWALLLVVALAASGANLPLAALVWLPARLVALVAMPLSFSIGQFLIDGPTSGLFEAAINAPGSALLGFEYYALSGGLPLALVFGVLAGLTVVRFVRGMRRRLDGLQEGSETWRKVTESFAMRALNWLLGGDWRRAEAESGFRVPTRAILTALLVVALYFAVREAPGPWLQPYVRDGLESYNGATVDLESVELDLAGGRMTLVGLAMADSADLDRDLFKTDRMEADFSARDLLRKRFTIDQLVSREAHQGTLRETRGVLIGAPRTGDAPDDEGDSPAGDGKTLDDYLEDARRWRERLEQLRDWLEKIAGPEDEGADDPESIRERLEREVREKGWARVAATHRRTGAPTVLLRQVVVDGLESEELAGDPLDVRADNLSTHPSLVAEAPRIRIRSRSGRIDFGVGLGGASSGGGDNDVALAWHRLATDELLDGLELDGEPILSGGSLDFDLIGSWSEGALGRIDFPLAITVRDGVWRIGGGEATTIDELVLPIGLRGPLDDPRISFDDDELRDALVEAGKAELARRLSAEADEELDELFQKGEEKLGRDLDPELKDKAKGLLKGLFGDD